MVFRWLQKVNETKKVQAALTEEFSKRGLNFMQLEPELHRAIIHEAMLFKSIERTVEMFFEIANMGYEKGLDHYGVSHFVRDAYRERMRIMNVGG